MFKSTTSSITPGRIQKASTALPNSQPTFDDDMDHYGLDENELDRNYPLVYNISPNTQQNRSLNQHSNQNKTLGTYYTPQLKRKRPEPQVASCFDDPLTEMLNTFQRSLDELNRKIDYMTQRDIAFEKQIKTMEKSVGGLYRKRSLAIINFLNEH
ncbi:unnamed protein product [Adineta steineri]|uniref:Uncharacterized protein n=1 Tax=Adineta steineri TaxID=433720 RepID=A0A815FXA1_9BILA|nr:unnamed protein product [Adineta steineri]